MSYAFELHFDKATDAAIRGVWDLLTTAGCNTARNGIAPHVTLAIASAYQPTLARELRLFALDHPPLPASFFSVGTFPLGVLYFSPVRSERLLAIHADFHRRFPLLPPAPNSHYYLPGAWQPHCTLAMNVADESVLGIIAHYHMPPPGSFARLRVVEYPALKMHFDCPLGGEEGLS